MKVSRFALLSCLAALSSAATASAQLPVTQGIVVDIDTLDPIPNSAALLVRGRTGVGTYISTTQLIPNAAHSVWITIEEADGDVFTFNVTGGPASGLGTGHFAAFTTRGPVPAANGIDVLVNEFVSSGGAVGNGLFDDPAGATISYLVRGHGPLLPGIQNLMFGTSPGGCDTNNCENLQRALF